MSRERLISFINKTNEELTSDRTKITIDVFKTRHLPTIAKNGKPTKELQNELIKLAGGELGVIDIVNDKMEVIISLPPAIGNENIIEGMSGKKLNSALANIGEIKDQEKAHVELDKLLSKNKDNISEVIKVKNPWSRVLEYFKEDTEKLPNKVKQEKIKVTFDYD